MTGVVTSGSPNSNQTATPVVLVNPDGTSAGTVKPQTKPADSTASDVPTLKADFNSLLAIPSSPRPITPQNSTGKESKPCLVEDKVIRKT
jgi:hypothetical protein